MIQLRGGIIQTAPSIQISSLQKRLESSGILLSWQQISEEEMESFSFYPVDFLLLPAGWSGDTRTLSQISNVPIVVLPPLAPELATEANILEVASEEELFHVIRGFSAARRTGELTDAIDDNRWITQIWENAPGIVSYFNSNFELKSANRAGRERLGQKKEMWAETLASIFSENGASPTEVKEYLNRHEIWRTERKLKDRQGQVFTGEILIQCLPGLDEQKYYMLIIQDTPDLSKWEQHEVQTSNWLTKLAETAHEITMLVSQDGRITYLSPSCHFASSHSDLHYLGENIFDLEMHGSPEVMDSIQRVMKTRREEYFENQYLISGENHWLGIRLIPIPGNDGEKSSLLMISSDLSAEKRSQLSLIQALEREREYNDLQTRFLSMVSHEFKTPLSTIYSSAELLRNYHEQLNSEKKRVLTDRILDAADVMNHLLEDVLVIGRIRDDSALIKPQWINPVEFCSELMESILWNDQFCHPIKLVTTCERTLVYVDPEVLHHILENLLNNAIQYSDAGKKIIIHLETEQEKLFFQIQDEGCGIPPDALDKVYDPFFRARNCPDIPGTGLGLTIVSKAVELMHGKIEIQSELGVGTRVSVMIPVQTKDQMDG